ncbi:MAG: hypothetical protein K2G13_04640 [Muribaculaceae bacterium]|nr:hypothetical protein [Muribaculaceae bacterium]
MRIIKIIVVALLIGFAPAMYAQNDEGANHVEKNNWGGKLIKSPFGLGLDIQTKYIWRGMEMMSEDSAPVLFPSVNYSWNGFFVYAMGGYAINGKYAEVDLGLSYSFNGITVGFNDYYYPTVDSKEDLYFEGGRNTGHWLEGCISFAPEKIPLIATLSNFFAGADKYINNSGKEKQAYSTYFELGTFYDFLNQNRLSLNVGAALNRSCYNNYEHGFSVCNIELKYTYTVQFKSGWQLPLNVAYIYNPVFDKSFVNFSANLAF